MIDIYYSNKIRESDQKRSRNSKEKILKNLILTLTNFLLLR